MYRRIGNYQKALASFDKAITLDPKHEIAHINKGVVLMQDLKDTKAAVKAWEELLKLNPDVKIPGSGMSLKRMVEQMKSGHQTEDHSGHDH